MTDPLEQLKQDLYAKIQATCKPEEPPSDIDLLKYSQLPEYQAHQKLRQQTEQRWKQAPMQGAIPFTTPDEEHIEIVSDALLDALDRLTFAHHLLENTGISKTHTALFTAVCDGLNATSQAIERSSDAPDAWRSAIAHQLRDRQFQHILNPNQELRNFPIMSQQQPQQTENQDFQPLSTYSQTTVKNESWINVTLTTEHSDGSKSQVFFIAKK